MAITFGSVTLNETRRQGDDEIDLAAGKHIKIETSPGGEELLDYVVPAGKAAHVLVYVRIIETDA